MKNLIALTFFLFTTFCIGNTFAQQKKSNFSGKWTLDINNSIFSGNLSDFYKKNEALTCSSQLIIVHNEPQLNIKELLSCSVKDKPQIDSTEIIENITFYTDNRGEKNHIPDNVILSTKTKWAENKIVVKNNLNKSDTTEYYLSEDGSNLIIRNYIALNVKPSNESKVVNQQTLI